jgi:hypothetical protein
MSAPAGGVPGGSEPVAEQLPEALASAWPRSGAIGGGGSTCTATTSVSAGACCGPERSELSCR